MTAAVLLAFLVAGIRGDLLDGSPVLLALMVLATVPFLLLIWLMPRIGKHANVIRFERSRVDGELIQHVSFGAAGFSPSRNGEQPIPWPMITRVEESRSYYHFYHALSEVPEYVPKRVLASADNEMLRSIVREHFRARPHDASFLNRAT